MAKVNFKIFFPLIITFIATCDLQIFTTVIICLIENVSQLTFKSNFERRHIKHTKVNLMEWKIFQMKYFNMLFFYKFIKNFEQILLLMKYHLMK